MTDIRAIADEVLELLVEEDPLGETVQGYPGADARLSDVSEEAQADLKARALQLAQTARDLDTDDWVTQAVAVDQAQGIATRMDSRLIEHAVADLLISPITRLLSLLPLVRPATAEQEQNFFTRLSNIPGYLTKSVARHRAGVAAGRTPVRTRAEFAISHLDHYLANPAEDPLRNVSVTNTAERDRLLDDLVRPAFAEYRQVLGQEIAPSGRSNDKPGLCWITDGDETYAALARMHTTTDRSPEELHQTGLDLIERLAGEYVEIGSRLFGVSTVAEVHERLKTDPAMRWTSAEELLAGARSAMERAEAAAPDWFGILPSQRCELRATPKADEENEAGAYYYPAALDGSRPGIFYANTYKATERDRFVSESIAFHESVPGHHFQMTIAQELKDVPQLRGAALINSYIEGWGLYSERLADEMGLYSDDLARLGMLASDSMRAARLVVDTGLHAFGWSRAKTVNYLRTNTVMSEVEIQSETDRYIEMPAQALSYMVGRLEILRLRERARAELGTAFDIKAFHDLVLGSGPLPMAVLDEVVARWSAR